MGSWKKMKEKLLEVGLFGMCSAEGTDTEFYFLTCCGIFSQPGPSINSAFVMSINWKIGNFSGLLTNKTLGVSLLWITG